MIEKYHLEFILHVYDISLEALRCSLSEFGEDILVTDSCPQEETKGTDYKVAISTQDPTLVFDICSQMGRIRSVRINEQEGKWM